MYRRIAVISLVVAFVGTAVAQEGKTVRWSTDVEGGIAAAKKAKRPIMFYVTRASERRDPDVERDQKRSFNDPRCGEMASQFACIQLSASQHRDLLNKWNLPSEYYMYIVFTSPDGDMIDRLDALGVANKDSFLQKMSLVFRSFRKQLFEKELKPKIDDPKTSSLELKKALETIKDLTILPADGAVITLLDRKDLDPKSAALVYDVLADLSTKASVSTLFARAREGDASAIKALEKCTPGAAEELLPSLDNDDTRVLAYNTITKICRIKDAKQGKFWEGKNERVQTEEIQRVKKQAQKVSDRWKEQNEDYR